MRVVSIIAVALAVTALSVGAQTTHLVPSQFPTIAAALAAAASGDTIVVAPGVYAENNLSFAGKDLVLRSEAGAGQTAIDLFPNGRAFEFSSGETNAAVVEGFSIINGRAPSAALGADGEHGGAILCTGSSNPTIRRCVFSDNRAGTGGGNFAGDGGDGGHGGALACFNSSPIVESCIFFANRSGFGGFGGLGSNGGDGGDGGAIANFGVGAPMIIGCTITANLVSTGGSGVIFGATGDGPGVYDEAGGATVINSIVSRNGQVGILGATAVVPSITGVGTVNHSIIEGGSAGIMNMDVDPQFAGGIDPLVALGMLLPPFAYDVRLLSTSPGIDAGDDSVATGTLDATNGPRRFYGGIDIGAAEYVGECFTGNVPDGAGGNTAVLAVDGSSAALVEHMAGTPLTIEVGQPPLRSAPANFVVFLQIGAIQASDTVATSIGPFCFLPALLSPLGTLQTLVDGLGLNTNPIFPATPSPFTRSINGLAIGTQITFQGAIEAVDAGPLTSLRRTNAVHVVVQ